MSEKPIDSKQDTEFDREGEAVDPRVQIELEKLNAATDDINKLEVDLDESRTAFRQLLYESSMRLDGLSKKLGSCVERARPYYEARIKAKEALHETQLAAVRFERANSAHAAAKEMVYLAEEGLCAEGRTFDHAWQEMLNHATMRVNESELERTLSEADHRRTSYSYQLAETNVQQLQKELKRSIAKSRSYFELKAQFNQILEEQKLRVKRLEKRVGAAKASYAEALHNLEQISDEIHRIRKHETENILVARGTGVGAELPFSLPQSTLSPDTHNTSSATYSSSTNADTDRWTDSTENSASECDEEYLKLPDKLGSSGCPIIPTSAEEGMSQQSEYLSLSSLYDSHVRNRSLHSKNTSSNTKQNSRPDHIVIVKSGQIEKQNSGSDSPEEENMIQSFFSKIVPAKLRQGSVNVQRNVTKSTVKIESVDSEDTCPIQEQKTIPNQSFVFHDGCSNQDITNVETWSEFSLMSNKTTPESERNVCKGEVWTEVNLNDSSSPDSNLDEVSQSRFIDVNETNSIPGKSKLDSSLSNWISRSSIEQSNNSRRQSLDSLILGGLATGERVKEILSQSIMKLNISSLKERRLSEPKVAKPGVRLDPSGGLKKVPSPLEKSMTYLNPEDESASDSESLASVEMLTDEQISSLMLEQNLNDVCQVLGTPVSEMTNLDFFSSTIVQ